MLVRLALCVAVLAMSLSAQVVDHSTPGNTVLGAGAAGDILCRDSGGNVVACDTVSASYASSLLTIPGLKVVSGGSLVDSSLTYGAGSGRSWGDGDTEIFESADDTLTFRFATSDEWTMSAVVLESLTNNGSRIVSTAGTRNVPTFSFRGDTASGMFRLGASHIAFSVGAQTVFELGGPQTALCRDATASTGSTLCVSRAGAGQGTDNIYEWQDNSSGILASVGSSGRVNATGVSASESYRSGLAVTDGTDTDHDLDIATGAAQSFDLSHDIILAASQAGKQLDVKWATGAAAGMLGMPDLTSAIVLTFSLTASPDTITAGSGTPFAGCNDGGTETGTIIIQGGSTNDGTYEVASCTDTVLTLGEAVLAGDETGTSGEYESRYVQPDTWYHLFLIELAGTEDICADVSEVAVNCLSESSYDQWRLLSSFLTNGTANIVAGSFPTSSSFVVAIGAMHSDTGTTTNSPGTPIKLVGTHTLSGLEVLFDEPVDGRLRYIGAQTLTFSFNSHLSFTSDESNHNVTLELAKNGTPLTDSSATVKIGTGTDVQYIAVGYPVSLATDDYLEAFIDTDGTDPDITIVHLSVYVVAVD